MNNAVYNPNSLSNSKISYQTVPYTSHMGKASIKCNMATQRHVFYEILPFCYLFIRNIQFLWSRLLPMVSQFVSDFADDLLPIQRRRFGL